jgi:hypothetical protein
MIESHFAVNKFAFYQRAHIDRIKSISFAAEKFTTVKSVIYVEFEHVHSQGFRATESQTTDRTLAMALAISPPQFQGSQSDGRSIRQYRLAAAAAATAQARARGRRPELCYPLRKRCYTVSARHFVPCCRGSASIGLRHPHSALVLHSHILVRWPTHLCTRLRLARRGIFSQLQ